MAARLILGSQNAIAAEALEEACAELGLEVRIERVEPEVRPASCPFGGESTAKAASDIAQRIIASLGDEPEDAWAIGIDDSVEERTVDGRLTYYAQTNIAFLHTDGSACFGVSEQVDVSGERVRESRWRDVPAGDVIAERTGCSPDDPHSSLTASKTSRKRLLKEAFVSLISYITMERGALD